MSVSATLQNIRNKVRQITGKPNDNQITNSQIDFYVNTFYIYDFPEHLRLQNLRVNYQFTTSANIAIYDFPTEMYLTNMPPVFIAGYQSYMTQSREAFFRINPALQYLQEQIYTGNGSSGNYTGQYCTATPIVRGFKRNPPGAYNNMFVATNQLNWMVVVSALDANGNSQTLVDSGRVDSVSPAELTQIGNLYDVNDPYNPNLPYDPVTNPYPVVRGTINYITGLLEINSTGFVNPIPSNNPINVQYTPYVASRPQSVVFYQDQFAVYPIPDQAYTVSFEAYIYPTALINSTDSPQLNEWWQLLAYGAADKIFADNADMENLQKFRPLLKEQMNLCQRRTIVQQTSERTATIYTEQTPFQQFPFGNTFGGF